MSETVYHIDDMEWEPAIHYPSGAEVKVLRRGEDWSSWTILLKMPPNWQMYPHVHGATEEHFVLEGAYEIDEQLYAKGTYQFIPTGTRHGLLKSQTGAVVLIVGHRA